MTDKQKNKRGIVKNFPSSFIINDNNINIKENHTNYIYLLQEREFISLNENTYKIGRSEIGPYDRFYTYPTKSKLLYLQYVENAVSMEKILIGYFHKYFIYCKGYGKEYFTGIYENMISLMNSVIHNMQININIIDIDRSLFTNNKYIFDARANINKFKLNNYNVNINIDYIDDDNEYIYLIRRREFIRLNKNIYKVGKSKCIVYRINDHSRGSEILLIKKVRNLDICEKFILDKFNDNFIQEIEYGKEYYTGNSNDMIDLINDIIHNNVFNTDKICNADDYVYLNILHNKYNYNDDHHKKIQYNWRINNKDKISEYWKNTDKIILNEKIRNKILKMKREDPELYNLYKQRKATNARNKKLKDERENPKEAEEKRKYKNELARINYHKNKLEEEKELAERILATYNYYFNDTLDYNNLF